MRYPRNVKILKRGTDTSAFLSIFFILVTFILLDSSFVLKKGISAQLELPDADLPGITGASIIVGIDRDGEYHYDGQIWNDKELLGKMTIAKGKNTTSATTLIIVPDKGVSIEKLSQLTTLAYQAEIQKILIATDSRK